MDEGPAELPRLLVDYGRMLWQAGFMPGSAGNISGRLGPDRILITPAGIAKASLSESDMVETDLQGRVQRGFHSPSSELDLHLRVYRTLPDCGAIVHAHPPCATGFAVAGEPLDHRVLPEMIVGVGEVPLVPYATPGTPELADAVEPFLADHAAVLLASHGALSWGRDLHSAWARMETLEHCAKVVLVARSLGRVTTLNREQTAALAQPGRTLRHG